MKSKLLLGALLAFVSTFAALPAVAGANTWTVSYGNCTQSGASPSAAVTALIGAIPVVCAPGNITWTLTSCGDFVPGGAGGTSSCIVHWDDGGGGCPGASCGDQTWQAAITCTPPAVLKPDGTCGSPDVCADQAGDIVDLTFFVCYTTSPAPSAACAGTPIVPPSPANFQGCKWTSGTIKNCFSYEGNMSQAFCTLEYTNTGQSATGPTSPAGTPTSACPAGQQIGYVNGKGGCYNTGTTSATSTTTASGAPPAPGDATTSTAPAPSGTDTASPTSSSSSTGGTSSATGIEQLKQQMATNTKLDALIAKPNAPAQELPTDYQRDTTGQTTNTKLEQLHTDLTPGAGLPGAGEFAATAATGVATMAAVTLQSLGIGAYVGGGGFSAWTGLPIIGGSDGCVTPAAFANYSIMGHSVNMDLCGTWLPFKAWLAWFLWAATAVFCYRRVTRTLGGNS